MRLTWFHGRKVASADDDGGRAAVPAGKRPPEKGGAGVARRTASAVVVRWLVDKAGKAFARSIPAARFGHLAYISFSIVLINDSDAVVVVHAEQQQQHRYKMHGCLASHPSER
ncbi:hypothetical protein GUJ93_ZPchr0007g6172 [Zizania palustris]|uniref:Uncharacterized protein n=1 Tax=Zizania palustris TaxID=103762 RepID=A0A8J5T4K9_ZIZPA|nr:hypothetical protein GUJ93_ZPchr0007g6172 [Zizania palustris]